jgi:ABC-type multidrug transport system fused ATPase/permease subunit
MPPPRQQAALPARGPARVALEAVTVDYGRGCVLRDAALAIEPGEHVALVGESGSGKSTILALLLGLVAPLRGRVLVGAVDLAGLDRAAWLRRVAWLPQRPTIFHGTLEHNIRLGRLDADEASVAEAARLAGVAEFLPRLPLGLLTRVGEGGHGLSAGQAQRVALARLLLRDPDLVLLDEPAAGLDAESERLVAGAIAALSRGRTTVVATHRPIAAVDRLLVVEAGRVCERAPAGGPP